MLADNQLPRHKAALGYEAASGGYTERNSAADVRNNKSATF
eukprot:gene21729-25788_t